MTDSAEIARSRRYGCIPDHPDARDLMFVAPPGLSLPDKVDLSANMPPVMDQGQIGSCTGHGSTAAMRAAIIKAGRPDVPLSRLYAYYNGRAYEGTTGQDAGAMIRDVVKGLVKFGAPDEALWPYVPTKFWVTPPAKAYADGERRQVLQYHRVSVGISSLKQALAAGFPVIIGVSLYESFESAGVAASGQVPMPDTGRESMLGGHCMLAFGYDDARRSVQVRNSWGERWGDHGNCWMPYGYFEPAYAADFWAITQVEAEVSA